MPKKTSALVHPYNAALVRGLPLLEGQRVTPRLRANVAMAEALIDALLAVGCVDDPTYPIGPSFRLDTRAGALHLYVSANGATEGATVFARFLDVARANEVLGPVLYLNTHSGKWNHHYFNHDAAAAVDDITRALARVKAPVVVAEGPVDALATGGVVLG